MENGMLVNPIVFWLLNWLAAAVALWVTASVVPGFRLRNFRAALVASAVLGAANFFLRPILLFLTLPLNILTLGLFTFVVSGALLKLCASVLSDFEIDGWLSAILGAFVLAVVSGLLRMLVFV